MANNSCITQGFIHRVHCTCKCTLYQGHIILLVIVCIFVTLQCVLKKENLYMYLYALDSWVNCVYSIVVA